MSEMGLQFDLGDALTTTRSIPTRQGNQSIAPAPRRRRGQQPEQLRMFMTPEELMRLPQGDMAHYGPGASDQDQRDYWSHKRGDAVLTDAGRYGNGVENLASSIRRQGVQRPVDVEHGFQPFAPWFGKDPTTLVNGAHRVAVANDVRPQQLLPVVHHSVDDEPEDLGSGKRLPAWARVVPKTMGWKDER